MRLIRTSWNSLCRLSPDYLSLSSPATALALFWAVAFMAAPGHLRAQPVPAQQLPSSPAVKGSAAADPQPASPSHVTVAEHAWTKEGILVLGVTIAGAGKTITLGSEVKGDAFSMATTWLVDIASEKKLRALPRVPRKPYFGPISGLIVLGPRDSLTFGAAYPHPPKPPPRADGQPEQNYRLRLCIPNLDAVEFSIPVLPGD